MTDKEMAISLLVEHVRMVQKTMTAEQRVDFWHNLEKDYCCCCGRCADEDHTMDCIGRGY